MNIFLIGFMGTGKSAVSKELKALLPDHTEYDMDAEIVSREGMPISEIFAQKGEEYFRDAETALLRELAAGDNAVVSCGGGTVLREINRSIIKDKGLAVLLTAEPETVLKRTEGDTSRPLLKGRRDPDSIRELMDAREEAYRAAADIVITTDDKDPGEIAGIIRSALL